MRRQERSLLNLMFIILNKNGWRCGCHEEKKSLIILMGHSLIFVKKDITLTKGYYYDFIFFELLFHILPTNHQIPLSR